MATAGDLTIGPTTSVDFFTPPVIVWLEATDDDEFDETFSCRSDGWGRVLKRP